MKAFVFYFNLLVIVMHGAILMQPNPVYPVLSWIGLGLGVLNLAFWLAANRAEACKRAWDTARRAVAQALRTLADAFDNSP